MDFLLCEPETLRPAIGVELVKPIGRVELREADQFMDDLFASAGLPLVHVPSREQYSEENLTELFELAVQRVKETEPLRATAKTDSVPMCPICGRMMVLRIHRGGPQVGKQYYGCSDNPHCHGVVEIK